MTAIKVPPLGESIVEATVSRWLKNEGDAVAVGDTLVELETDKITVEVPAMSAGVLTKRAHAEGRRRQGRRAARRDRRGRDSKGGAPAPVRGATSAGRAAPAGCPGEARRLPLSRPSQLQLRRTSTDAAEVRASPAAQRVAAERGDRSGERFRAPAAAASSASPTSSNAPSNRAHDRRRLAPFRRQPHAATRRATAAPSRRAPAETREKMTTRRKRIAEHLLESQHATAHLTTFNEIDMTAVIAVRERLKERVEKEHGVKLSFMPFFVKAACLALKTYPVVNAQIDGDSIVYKHYVNMGIAVASDAGLVVPNIKDADRKGMLDISRDITSVAKRARDGKLTMDDLTGGTFTITNGGVFGSLVSTPISTIRRSAFSDCTRRRIVRSRSNGKVEIRPMMYVALSYDHRSHRRAAGRALPRSRQGTDGRPGVDADRLSAAERAAWRAACCSGSRTRTCPAFSYPAITSTQNGETS